MFINDFDIRIHNYGDADNFALITIDDGRDNGVMNRLPQKNIPIEHVTPELIGEAVAQYIRENLTE